MCDKDQDFKENSKERERFTLKMRSLLSEERANPPL